MAERFERFSFAILEIYHHWHTIAAREMAQYGLKVPHAIYLLTMQHYPEGLTAAQLTELCGRDKSEVSRCIAELEKKGIVTRTEVNQGAYRALLTLSDSGRAAAEHLRARADWAVERGGRGVSEADREVFYEVLELIAYHLQIISEEGIPDLTAEKESDSTENKPTENEKRRLS